MSGGDEMETSEELKCIVSSSNTFFCVLCSKTFKQFRYLKVHTSNVHPEHLPTLIKLNSIPKVYKYKCSFCERNFNKITHLRHHQRSVHGKLSSDASNINCTTVSCGLCGTNSSRNEMLEHFKQIHAISLETEKLTFPDMHSFLLWKDDVESDTNSKFVSNVRGPDSRTAGIMKYYYACHRSGTYVPKGSGIRHLKIQGSRKINAFCPAYIKAIAKENGELQVDFTKTHVGHTMDIGHLNLTAKDRSILASKIASKIPFDSILNELQESVTGSNLNRLSLLTKKDLHNIESAFNLKSEPSGSNIESAFNLKSEPSGSNIESTFISDSSESSSLIKIKETIRKNLADIGSNLDTMSMSELQELDNILKYITPRIANTRVTVPITCSQI